MAKIDGIDVPKLTFPEAAAPSTPASGKVVTYAKSDGLMYSKDDAGVETAMSAGAPGASGLVLLEQHTASSSATLDFTTCISATYDEYLIELVGLQPATNNVDLYMRMSTNGGSSYDSSNLYATSVFAFTSASSALNGNAYNAPTAQIALRFNAEIGNTSTASASGFLRLFHPGSTALHKFVRGEFFLVTGGITMIGTIFAGAYKSTTAVNAFRFLMSSGNIAAGTIRVYGLAK